MGQKNKLPQHNQEQNSKSVSGIGKIDKVDPVMNFHEATGNKWVSIFQKLNPLGEVARAYTQTLAYKIEIRRLDIEEERIKKQAETMNHIIEKEYQLKKEELEQRRIYLIGIFENANRELERLHKERIDLLKEASRILNFIKKSNDIQEKMLLKEIHTEYMNNFSNCGHRSIVSLQTLIQSLPQVSPSALIDSTN